MVHCARLYTNQQQISHSLYNYYSR